MNDKFLKLSLEKRKKIILASMEVFGKYEYKRAVTDEIAYKAGISKGLLFYYFHNKHGLYMFLYQYCFDLMKTLVVDEEFKTITDFFDLLEYGAQKKAVLLNEYPYIIEFVLRAYYSQHEDISEDAAKNLQQEMSESFATYFNHIDFTKFKEEVDPTYVYQMLIWMIDGYLHERQNNQLPIELEEVMKEFRKWRQMFRKMVYKEEFL